MNPFGFRSWGQPRTWPWSQSRMPFGGQPAPGVFPGPTVAGYTPNIEFQLNPMDPGFGTTNRDKILAEQQRILGVFNDFMIAQKLMILGQADARMPQLANEQANREQLQSLIRDMAEMNVNKQTMTGLVNNFGSQYCKFITDRDAVEAQRQLNDVERARMLGYLFLPPPLQLHLRICQISVVLSLGGTFGACMAFWSGSRALQTSMLACRTAGLQCLVMGLLQFIAIAARLISRCSVARFACPSIAFGRDRMYVSRIWDYWTALVLCAIISFGAWMWTKGNEVYLGHGSGGHIPPMHMLTKTLGGAVSPTAVATAAATVIKFVLPTATP
ncbi:hypothetical protein TWF696_001537 [Orbilia brochopaga]|uniref:Uncharacterized protein n=1 Tax=Orbilia brochopaga TaxID=3140254 RepID=A0AAV9UBW9_9PEZI